MDPFPADCAEKFRPVRLLARGGFGSVWLATQARLRREVAIKLLHADLLSSPHDVDRFLAEARVTAKFRHPNIVLVLDHGAEHDVPWIAFEYLPGRTLAQMLENGPLPWQRALAIAAQIASALEEAHAHGVLHRDIKPSNIVEVSPDEVKVADFGIAQWAGRKGLKTATGVIVGTPYYIAPEIIAGEPASASSDLYALGVVTYEMLSGRVPFQNSNPLKVLTQHREAAVPPPSTHNPDLPPHLDEVVAKMLAKSPAERHPNATAVRAALERCASSPDPASRRPPPVRADGRAATLDARARRRPVMPRQLAITVLAATALGLVAAVSLRLRPSAAPAPVPAVSLASSSPLAAADRAVLTSGLAELAARVQADPELRSLSITDATTLPEVPEALQVAVALDVNEAAHVRTVADLANRVERACRPGDATFADRLLLVRARAYRFVFWRRRNFCKRVVDVLRWAVESGNDSLFSTMAIDMKLFEKADHADGLSLLQQYLDAARGTLRALPAELPGGGAGVAELLDDVSVVAREANAVQWTPLSRAKADEHIEAFKRGLAAGDGPLASSIAKLSSALWELGRGTTVVRRQAHAQMALEELRSLERQAPAAGPALRPLLEKVGREARRQ